MLRFLVMFPNMTKEVFTPSWVGIEHGRIASVEEASDVDSNSEPLLYMFPGLVDAHIHIESSMLSPSRFAEIAVKHGTVATVSDPHEIANVLGKEGIQYMLDEAASVPLKIYYTVPSCVPATDFEVSGAKINSNDVADILRNPHMVALGEMMNFPGVIFDDQEVHKKIMASSKIGKPVDGHAPGLTGKQLEKYVDSGISTDHEAVDIHEAREKIRLGMKILIREGSAAKNFDALRALITESNGQVMLCSDDLHPDDLLDGHIDKLIRRGLENGHSIFDLIRAASANPITHYKLNVGQLKIGDPADFILVDSVDNFKIVSTWIEGNPVYENGKTSFMVKSEITPNTFIKNHFDQSDFALLGEKGRYRIIEAMDGSLLTNEVQMTLESMDGILQADISNDILKIAVVNRYFETKPAIGWIKNFGISSGALASSVAHDSHNIIVVGCSDYEIAKAVNELITSKGGICVVSGDDCYTLPLPVAGIMSNQKGEDVARAYEQLTKLAKDLGSKLNAPFMTLSFMALLVIPSLKIGDQGLFDVNEFKFVSAFVDK